MQSKIKNQSKEKYKSMNRHEIPFYLHHPAQGFLFYQFDKRPLFIYTPPPPNQYVR